MRRYRAVIGFLAIILPFNLEIKILLDACYKGMMQYLKGGGIFHIDHEECYFQKHNAIKLLRQLFFVQVLDRGEKIELLVDKTESLRSQVSPA